MAAFTMRVDHNIVDVQKMIGRLSDDIKKKAIIPAVNKTAATVKTRVSRYLADEIGSPVTPVKKQISVTKAHRGSKGEKARYYATVDATEARAVNLIEYVKKSNRKPGYFNQVTVTKSGKRRYKSKGVVANAWGKKKVYKGTFIGTSGKGELRVYRRIGKARNRITLVSGGSPRKVFSRPETFKFMREVIAERFPIEFERAMRSVVARANKKK